MQAYSSTTTANMIGTAVKELLPEFAEFEVVRSKVVPPLRQTVRLIYHQVTYEFYLMPLSEERTECLCSCLLWCEI